MYSWTLPDETSAGHDRRHGPEKEDLARRFEGDMMGTLAAVDGLLVIADIARTVNDFRPLGETLSNICLRVGGLHGYDRTAVFMPRAEGDALEIMGSWGLSDAYVEQINHGHPLRLSADSEHGLAPTAESFRSGMPVAITDVDLEPRLQPWRTAMRVEHYRALVCMPVIVRSRVIGVLVCYSGEPHLHSREELDLLQLVSRLAGIAIETARVAAGQRQASDELRRLSERLQEQNRELARLSSIQARLTEQLVHPDATAVERIARTLAEITTRSVLVAGRSGNVIAHIGPMESRTMMGQVAARRDVSELLRRQELVAVGGSTCVRLGLPETPMGCLVLRPALDDSVGTSALAAVHAAVVITAELLGERADRTLETYARPAVLLALANGLYGNSEAKEAAGVMGIPTDAALQLAVVRCGSQESAHRVARRLDSFRNAGWPLVTATQSGCDVVALLTAGPPQQLRRAAMRLRELQPHIQRIGVSAAFDGLGDMVTARRAAELATAIDSGSVTLYEDLGPYGSLICELPPGRAFGLVKETLGPVLDYDAVHGSQLVHTLKAYVEHSGHVQVAATALHIHPNTMQQRLRRIAQLAQVDIHDYRNLGSLVLALEWDRMMRLGQSSADATS
ncbi:MAG: GAF domain-containing protein [Candidatus Dormibacteraeota bacterium]|uniref:GAF domain-containing protein n=1 Tax=Candidatus Dormiibacter inghamiae TaxID=3127013 RepID=A0A934N5W0_9BACT|nr:GAF domain-containing protein [Candidatus Dormibacteraeota bacterium]MBJ7605279.1 GAF domain-containing protein [Candidatus Dormibacteraeota bacterium]